MTVTTPTMSHFGQTIFETKYAFGETWAETAQRIASSVVGPYFPDHVSKIAAAIEAFEFMPGGRHIANAGRSNFLNNCFLYRVEDTKESIADAFRKVTVTGMTGGGVCVVWSDLRPRNARVHSSKGAVSTGPCAFMYAVNEIGRGVVGGGGRRFAIWAGLHWWHPDVFEFMAQKDWSDEIKANKEKDYSAYAPMDMTNISVILDDEFFEAYENPEFTMIKRWNDDEYLIDHAWARRVYDTAIEKMVTTGEPGFSVDLGDNRFENLRNPCCEITSEDDSDVCCLGSVNLAQIEDLERFKEVTALGTMYLLCATLESDVPHEEVLVTREKNRRLGLGLMGLHEWLVARGYRYEPNEELGQWLSDWERVSDWTADTLADRLGISRPKKKRAVAPTGTLGIIAGEGTTTGIEPLFAVAMKRVYMDANQKWKFQYVIDGTAQRLIEEYDVDPLTIETAYDLAFDPARRLEMQAFVQKYTDHAISSTLNLPRVEHQMLSPKEFGTILYEYLPQIRGVTAYPDGARGGQPLNVVTYTEAMQNIGQEFDVEQFGLDQACVNGVCGV
jgi:ribonucleoside-diphosphate reductase alpha chain